MISEKIADFVVTCRFDDLPTQALDVLKLSLLDWCAVGLAGIDEQVSEILRETALEETGEEQCSIFGSEQKLPPRAAALVNGTTSHALDYDDTHFMHVGHTSVVILPAALAIAEGRNLSGRQFLKAALIGSEVACYVGQWLGRDHYNHGFHQTATSGAFGAVAAVASLLNFDHGQTLNALGLMSTRASGLKSQFGTMGKPYNAGMAAANAVEVCLLAEKGFEARQDGLECFQGFATTHAADEKRSDRGFDELGKTFVFGDVQHKFHACCHGLHAAIEAVVSLRDHHAIAPDDVSQVIIQTNPRWLNVCDIKSPQTGLEAKFSYGFVTALALTGIETAALKTYCHDNCLNGALNNLSERTNVVPNSTVTDMASIVTIKLNDGREYSGQFDLADLPEIETRQSRVLSKASALIGKPSTQTLWAKISLLEDAGMNDFVEVFRAQSEKIERSAPA